MQNKTLSGSLMVLAAAALWGTTGTAQSLTPPLLSAYWVGALRLVVAALFFGACVGGQVMWRSAPQRAGQAASPLPAVRFPWPGVLLAGVCIASYNLAFFAGVKASGVAVGTAVALGSAPVWAGVLQWLTTRAVPGVAWWLGTALAVTGGVLMVLGNVGGAASSTAPPGAASAVNLPGALLCLTAGLSYAAYALVNERLVQTMQPAQATFSVFAAATCLAVPLAWLLAGPLSLSGGGLGGVATDIATDTTTGATAGFKVVLMVLYLGVVATGLAYLLFSHALQRIGSATAVTLALAEPLVAFVLALVLLREPTTQQAALGLCCVLAGLVVVVAADLRRAARNKAT